MWSCVHRTKFSGKICFAPKIVKMGQKWGPKTGFSSLLKNLVINFYWIWSVMKIYIICCVPAQISYLGKIFVPEIWAKMFSANQIAGFFYQPYLQNKSMKKPGFWHFDTNSHKLKVDQKILGWAWSEIGMVSLVAGL